VGCLSRVRPFTLLHPSSRKPQRSGGYLGPAIDAGACRKVPALRMRVLRKRASAGMTGAQG